VNDLADFLSARLDERQRRAEAAHERWDDESELQEWNDLSDEAYAHARNLDPARVLREVEAGRAILAEYERLRKSYAAYPNAVNAASVAATQATIRILGTIARDHPDYRQEWEPLGS
jgi:hypothetical protein